MDHPNNQDDRGDKLGKRSVLADRDGPSQPHQNSIFSPTQLGYGVNVYQEGSGSNFTQDMPIASSIGQINPTHNISNWIHGDQLYNPYNNQDDRGDKLVKRSVLADWDGPSQPHQNSIFPPIRLGYGVNVNQERSSWHQLRSNFTQDMQLSSSIWQLNPTHNISNFIHGWRYTSGVSQCVLGSSQIPRSDSKAEDPSSSHLVESTTQGKMPGGSKNCTCKKRRCLSRYCECFANKVYCKNCQCRDCENIVENEHAVAEALKKLLKDKPTAYDFKGCACRNTNCKKNYCVCHAHDVKCTNKCRCINCENSIGARDYGEITVPGEMNTQAEHNNIQTNVLVEQQQIPVQYPNSTAPSNNNNDNNNNNNNNDSSNNSNIE